MHFNESGLHKSIDRGTEHGKVGSLMGQLGVEKIYIEKMSGKSKSSFFTEEWQNSNEPVPKNVQLLQRE